jgi:hypothetical protein
LLLAGAGRFGQPQRLAVLGEAALDLAPGEVDIGAQGVQSRELDRHSIGRDIPGLRLGFGLGESGRCLVEPVEHREALRQAEPGTQPRPSRRRVLQGSAEGGDGFFRAAKALEQLAAEIGQSDARGGRHRKGQAAAGQVEGQLAAVVRGGRFRLN